MFFDLLYALQLLSIIILSAFLFILLLLYAEHYAYYLLILLVPFSQSIPVLSIGSRSINLGMDTVFIAILVLWHLIPRMLYLRLPCRLNFLSVILVCWFIWNFITICISSLYLDFNQVSEGLVVLLRWGQYLPIFFILANGKLSNEQSKIAVLTLCVSGVLAAGLGFYQIYEGLNPLYFKGAPSFTLPLFREADPSVLVDENGFYMGSANYNVVGAYLAIAILFTMSILLSCRSNLLKCIYIIAVFFMIGGVVITSSRSSFIALLLSVLYFAYKHSHLKLIFSIVAVSLILVPSFFFFHQHRLIVDLTETMLNFGDVVPGVLAGETWNVSSNFSSQVYGAAYRLVGMRDALYVFFHNPISGYGFNAYQFFGLKNTPDNYFFQTLAETGIVGILLCGLFFKKAFDSVSRSAILDSDLFVKNYRIALSSVIFAMLLVNFTSGIFYVQKVWGVFLIFVGIWCSIRRTNLVVKGSEV